MLQASLTREFSRSHRARHRDAPESEPELDVLICCNDTIDHCASDAMARPGRSVHGYDRWKPIVAGGSPSLFMFMFNLNVRELLVRRPGIWRA